MKSYQFWLSAIHSSFQVNLDLHYLFYETEWAKMKDHNQFGKFELTDIPPVPFRFVQIEVTFDIDNSISNVFSLDKRSRKEKIKGPTSWYLSMENI